MSGPTPLLDLFKRGEVDRDVRMQAAEGALAPRAHEQVALLALLTEDADPDIRATAESTLAQISRESMAAFLGRSDVPDALRDFFRGRGIEPDPAAASATDDPLIDAAPATDEAAPAASGDGDAAVAGAEDAERSGAAQRLSLLNVSDKMKHAMKGTKEERAILVRDPNKLVSVAVLSSPKLTESEVEQFAKMANVSEEVLRIIGMNRAWIKNYGVIAALTRNPKTPLAVSMRFVQRLTERDLKMIALDRNLQEPLKQIVKKRLQGGDP